MIGTIGAIIRCSKILLLIRIAARVIMMNQYVYEIQGEKGIPDAITRFRKDRKEEDRNLFICVFHNSSDSSRITKDVQTL